MELSARANGQVWVLELTGKLALEPGAATLRTAVRTALAEGHKWLLCDLSQVTLVDSTGLGTLVSCLVSTRNRGGEMGLLRPSPKVADVLAITETDKLFRIFEDEQEAVRSLALADPPEPSRES